MTDELRALAAAVQAETDKIVAHILAGRPSGLDDLRKSQAGTLVEMEVLRIVGGRAVNTGVDIIDRDGNRVEVKQTTKIVEKSGYLEVGGLANKDFDYLVICDDVHSRRFKIWRQEFVLLKRHTSSKNKPEDWLRWDHAYGAYGNRMKSNTAIILRNEIDDEGKYIRR